MNCKNCGNTLSGSYCTSCGQKAKTSRFDWQYLGKQILDSVDFDRGFFHTLYSLLRRPGNAINGYINGKRIGFTNPFRLFLIVGALTNFLTYEFDTFSLLKAEDIIAADLPEIQSYFKYSSRYFSFFSLVGVPLFSFFTWILYKKAGYNFIEHFILNMYIAIGQFLLMIVFVPIIDLGGSILFIQIYGTFNFLYNIWVLVTFFKWNRKSFLAGILSVGLPSTIIPYYGYVVYRLSPQALWELLDQILT